MPETKIVKLVSKPTKERNVEKTSNTGIKKIKSILASSSKKYKLPNFF